MKKYFIYFSIFYDLVLYVCVLLDKWFLFFIASEVQTPAQLIDYNFAREELMLNELSNDPIQAAISRLEKQHEDDKQVALEKQRQEYEKHFQQLKNMLSPTTPYGPYTYDPFRYFKLKG